MKKNIGHALAVLCVLSTILAGSSLALDSTVGPRFRVGTSRRVRRGWRWDRVFRPSRASLLLQNQEIDRLELPRIQDEDELNELKARGELLAIQESDYLRFDPRLDPDRRYCRPWTREFVEDISEAYYKQFHRQIQLNSAVRTVQVQKKLRRHNRNAAPEKGEIASSHLAGVTVDLQRRGMSREQIKWMQQYLLPLKNMGLIEPEEERRQWVFHVMVSGRYSEWHAANMPDATQMASSAPEVKPAPVEVP